MLNQVDKTWEQLSLEEAIQVVRDIPILFAKCNQCRPNAFRGDMFKELWYKEMSQDDHQLYYFREKPADPAQINANRSGRPTRTNKICK
jgi:hypothetical protein